MALSTSHTELPSPAVSHTSDPDVRPPLLDPDGERTPHWWFESEKAGYDLGEGTVRRWVSEHWTGYVRSRWVEHLQGKCFWVELDRGDFGLLQREFQDQQDLLDAILEQLKSGRENLDVIVWALSSGISIEPVYEILKALDINSRRLMHRFEKHQFGLPRFQLTEEARSIRANRILAGEIRSNDYLPTSNDIIAFVADAETRGGVAMLPEYRQRMISDLTLQAHHAGDIVLCHHTSEGVIVLAIGASEIDSVLESLPPDKQALTRTEYPAVLIEEKPLLWE